MGSLLQLHTTNDQDTVLMSTNTKHSQFVTKYSQHHHFASEHRRVVVDDAAHDGQRIVIPVPRVADLLTSIILTATMTKTTEDEWDYPLEASIDRIELMVGGMCVEEFSGVYLRIYDDLYRSATKRLSYAFMGNFHHDDPPGTIKDLYMPLPFPCCSPIPLIGLSLAEVQIVVHTTKPLKNVGLDCEYVYCMPAERLQWLQPYEITLRQVQHLSFPLTPTMFETQTTHTFPIDDINHPVYKLIVVATHKDRHGAFTGSGRPFEDAEAYAPLLRMRLLLDGKEATPWRLGSHHRQLNMFSQGILPSAGVYVFDFGFGQGQGTINFSQLQSAVLQIVFKKHVQNTTTDDTEGLGLDGLTELHVFALNYNWLKVADGQAGVAFA